MRILNTRFMPFTCVFAFHRLVTVASKMFKQLL
jgi:hypothetical protein